MATAEGYNPSGGNTAEEIYNQQSIIIRSSQAQEDDNGEAGAISLVETQAGDHLHFKVNNTANSTASNVEVLQLADSEIYGKNKSPPENSIALNETQEEEILVEASSIAHDKTQEEAKVQAMAGDANNSNELTGKDHTNDSDMEVMNSGCSISHHVIDAPDRDGRPPAKSAISDSSNIIMEQYVQMRRDDSQQGAAEDNANSDHAETQGAADQDNSNSASASSGAAGDIDIGSTARVTQEEDSRSAIEVGNENNELSSARTDHMEYVSATSYLSQGRTLSSGSMFPHHVVDAPDRGGPVPPGAIPDNFNIDMEQMMSRHIIDPHLHVNELAGGQAEFTQGAAEDNSIGNVARDCSVNRSIDLNTNGATIIYNVDILISSFEAKNANYAEASGDNNIMSDMQELQSIVNGELGGDANIAVTEANGELGGDDSIAVPEANGELGGDAKFQAKNDYTEGNGDNIDFLDNDKVMSDMQELSNGNGELGDDASNIAATEANIDGDINLPIGCSSDQCPIWDNGQIMQANFEGRMREMTCSEIKNSSGADDIKGSIIYVNTETNSEVHPPEISAPYTIEQLSADFLASCTIISPGSSSTIASSSDAPKPVLQLPWSSCFRVGSLLVPFHYVRPEFHSLPIIEPNLILSRTTNYLNTSSCFHRWPVSLIPQEAGASPSTYTELASSKDDDVKLAADADLLVYVNAGESSRFDPSSCIIAVRGGANSTTADMLVEPYNLTFKHTEVLELGEVLLNAGIIIKDDRHSLVGHGSPTSHRDDDDILDGPQISPQKLSAELLFEARTTLQGIISDDKYISSIATAVDASPAGNVDGCEGSQIISPGKLSTDHQVETREEVKTVGTTILDGEKGGSGTYKCMIMQEGLPTVNESGSFCLDVERSNVQCGDNQEQDLQAWQAGSSSEEPQLCHKDLEKGPSKDVAILEDDQLQLIINTDGEKIMITRASSANVEAQLLIDSKLDQHEATCEDAVQRASEDGPSKLVEAAVKDDLHGRKPRRKKSKKKQVGSFELIMRGAALSPNSTADDDHVNIKEKPARDQQVEKKGQNKLSEPVIREEKLSSAPISDAVKVDDDWKTYSYKKSKKKKGSSSAILVRGSNKPSSNELAEKDIQKPLNYKLVAAEKTAVFSNIAKLHIPELEVSCDEVQPAELDSGAADEIQLKSGSIKEDPLQQRSDTHIINSGNEMKSAKTKARKKARSHKKKKQLAAGNSGLLQKLAGEGSALGKIRSFLGYVCASLGYAVHAPWGYVRARWQAA